MRINKVHLVVFLLLIVILPMRAQGDRLVNIGLQARVDYQRESLDGK